MTVEQPFRSATSLSTPRSLFVSSFESFFE